MSIFFPDIVPELSEKYTPVVPAVIFTVSLPFIAILEFPDTCNPSDTVPSTLCP